MKKTVFFVISFEAYLDNKGNSRFIDIMNLLKNDYNCVLISTDYSHILKKFRTIDRNTFEDKNNIKLILLHELGYNKNISIKRFISHFYFSRQLKKFLLTSNKPSKIYCSVPDFNVAKVCADYCDKFNVEFILDIQDIWPEAFKLVIDTPIINNTIYRIMEKVANSVYKEADKLIAVSDTYLERARRVNDTIYYLSAYLGTKYKEFKQIYDNASIIRPAGEFWVIYIGTLGRSYNIEMIISAVAQLNREGKNIKFLCLGSGPKQNKLIEQAKNEECNAYFAGNVTYDVLIQYLKSANVAMNILFDNAAQSVTNKLGDYICAGLPIINTQKNKEVINLIENNKIGVNIDNDISQIKNSINAYYYQYVLNKIKPHINESLIKEKFDRNINNKKIVNIIRKDI